MQCPSSPAYQTSVEQKRHAQEVAKKQRQRLGTSKLRELLREKCRIRVINARKQCMDSSRSMQLSELNAILRSELDELEQDIEIEQQVYEELLAEVNELYALDIQELEKLYNESTEELPLLCPVCLKKPLQRLASSYKCVCGVQFEHAADMVQLRQLLQSKIDAHEVNCTRALRFFIEPEEQHLALGAMCGSCDYVCTF